MNTDKGNERIYELLEKYDFSELSNIDKAFVLSCMTEQEYISMRKAISDTTDYFSQTEEPVLDSLHHQIPNIRRDKKNKFVKLIRMPVELYKVAASVAVILAVTLCFQHFKSSKPLQMLAVNDTVFVQKTDTVYSHFTDTVEVVKEKVVYLLEKPVYKKPADAVPVQELSYDCNREMCPNDVDRIKAMSINRQISKDSVFADFVVTLN